MSDIVKPSDNSTSGSSRGRLKSLTSGSSWVSPFRTADPKRNFHDKFKRENSIKNVQVPQKFKHHPTLKAEGNQKGGAKPAQTEQKTEKVAENEEEQKKTATEPSNGSEDGEKAKNIENEEVDGGAEEEEVKRDDESERPLSEKELAEESVKDDNEEKTGNEVEKADPKDEGEEEFESEEAEMKLEGDDNIEELVHENPIEIPTQPEMKYEPLDPPNPEVLEKLQGEPGLLSHYNELNAAAIGSIARNLDDPKKVIDMGSGLKLTQQQLLDIAASRVAPVLKNINEEVSKSRDEDEIKRQKSLAKKVASHDKKLLGIFQKHVRGIDKNKAKFDKEIELKLKELDSKIKATHTSASDFETTTKGEIEKAEEDFKKREEEAVEKHGVDKETLNKNHEELAATKKQEIEDAKENQEKTTQEIEELKEKAVSLEDSNSKLESEIDDLKTEVEAKTAELEELKSKHEEKLSSVESNKKAVGEINEKLSTARDQMSQRKAKHDKIAAEVGVLTGVLAAYASKLTQVKTSNESHGSRIAEAKQKKADWDKEKEELARKSARESESRRLALIEEAQTQKVKEELERKAAKEKAEREAAEKAEEEAKKEQEAKEEAERKAAKEEAEREEAKRAEEEAKRVREEEAERKAKEDAETAIAEQKKREEEDTFDPQVRLLKQKKEREAKEREFEEMRKQEELLYARRKQQETEEYERLQAEIEELKKKHEMKLNAEKEKAQALADLRLSEIDQLQKEQEARLELLKQQRDYEDVQRGRLEEEAENLRKIRELREMKINLANDIENNEDLTHIKQLTQQRELEIAALSKQIQPVGKKENEKSFLGSSNDLNGSSGQGATSKENLVKQNNVIIHLNNGKISQSSNDTMPTPLSTKPSSLQKIRSLKDRLKRKSTGSNGVLRDSNQKDTSKKQDTAGTDHEVKSKLESHSKSKEAQKNHPENDVNGHDSDSSYETYSMYEEVSDGEFEANRGNKDYLEVSSGELRAKGKPVSTRT